MMVARPAVRFLVAVSITHIQREKENTILGSGPLEALQTPMTELSCQPRGTRWRTTKFRRRAGWPDVEARKAEMPARSTAGCCSARNPRLSPYPPGLRGSV